MAASGGGQLDTVWVTYRLDAMGYDARSREITGILGVGGILVLELGSSLARWGRGGRRSALKGGILGSLGSGLGAGLSRVASQS